MRNAVKAPGSNWYPTWYYGHVYGELSQERLDQGHRAYKHEGKDGVMVPEAPIVKFRSQTAWESQISEKHKAADMLFPQEMAQMGHDWVQGNGPRGAPFNTSMQFVAADDFDPEADDDDEQQSSQPARPVPAGIAPPVTPHAQGKAKAKARGKAESTNLPLPFKSEQGQGQAGEPQVQVKIEQGQGQAAQPQAGTPQKQSTGRGRKPKAWANLVDVEICSFSSSSEDSPLWNGVELATAIKHLENLEKEITKRIAVIAASKNPDLTEHQLCLKAVKRSTNVNLVLKAVQTKGLASKEFADAFDRAETCLLLSPLAEIAWPAWMKWARHRLLINDHCGDAMSWLQKIGSKALSRCGRKDVESEQQTFLSEFLSQALKLPEFKACVRTLTTLFQVASVPLILEHLSPDIAEFGCAMQQILEPEPQVLRERHAAYELAVGLFDDAEKFDSDMPDSQRYLCNLVLGFPKGRKLVDDARLLYDGLDRDLKLVEDFNKANCKFHAFMSGLEPLKAFHCSFLSLWVWSCLPVDRICHTLCCLVSLCLTQEVDMTIFQTSRSKDDLEVLGKVIAKLGETYAEAAQCSIEENMPDKTTAQGDVCKLLGLVHSTLFTASADLLIAEASEASVKAWFAKHHGNFMRVKAAIDYMSSSPLIFRTASDKFEQCVCIVSMVTWISRSMEATKEDLTQKESAAILSELAQLTTQAQKISGTDELCALVPLFGGSPFVAALSAPLLEAQANEIATLAEPLLSRLRGASVLKHFKDVHTRLCDKTVVDEKVISRLCQKAIDMRDTTLHKQVSYIHSIQQVSKSVLAASSHVHKYFSPTCKYADSKISEDHVACLRDMRKALKQFNDSHLQSGDFASRTGGRPMIRQHYTGFDGIIDPGAMHQSVEAETDRIQAVMASRWMSDLQTLESGIRRMCPQWQDQKEVLLDCPEMCAELMKNKHYRKIGGLSGEIGRAVKFLKCLHADGGPRLEGFTREKIASFKSTANFGVETVAYTYMVYHLYTVFPKIGCSETMTTRVAEVTYNIETRHHSK